MGWKEYYESKIMSAEDAVKMINSGDKVVLAHCIGEPPALVDAMVANHAAYKNVEVSHMVSHGSGGYTNPEYAENFHTNVWFASGNTRKCIEAGNGDFTPMFFHEIPILMRTGDIKVDVAMIMVTPPDENGKVSTGVSADYTVQAVKSARVVLAQVNNNMPFTYGDAIFDVDEIDAFVLEDTPLVELPPAKIGPVEEAIGKNCAELINDGDTLQLGIGAIPDAVCHQLTNKKHLGIHSEMLGDGPILLYEAGAIDGIRNRWQELWYITLPGMKHMLLFSAVMQISSAFSISAVIQQLAGYPTVSYAADTIVSYLSDVGTVKYEMGYASALSVVLFLLMVATRWLTNKLINKTGR